MQCSIKVCHVWFLKIVIIVTFSTQVSTREIKDKFSKHVSISTRLKFIGKDKTSTERFTAFLPSQIFPLLSSTASTTSQSQTKIQKPTIKMGLLSKPMAREMMNIRGDKKETRTKLTEIIYQKTLSCKQLSPCPL